MTFKTWGFSVPSIGRMGTRSALQNDITGCFPKKDYTFIVVRFRHKNTWNIVCTSLKLHNFFKHCMLADGNMTFTVGRGKWTVVSFCTSCHLSSLPPNLPPPNNTSNQYKVTIYRWPLNCVFTGSKLLRHKYEFNIGITHFWSSFIFLWGHAEKRF